MTQTSTAWRRIGAVLFALVLSLLIVGPGIDTIICRDELTAGPAAELSVTAVGDHAQVVQAHDADAGGLSDHGPDGLACVHGHCHHAGAYMAADLRAADEPDAPRAQHALLRSRVAVSDPKFMLMRPPRA
ncbi:MAG: hypothetical protein AB1942_00150 [Pseudomonadota bacterium]